jgi:hypothetical protein
MDDGGREARWRSASPGVTGQDFRIVRALVNTANTLLVLIIRPYCKHPFEFYLSFKCTEMLGFRDI